MTSAMARYDLSRLDVLVVDDNGSVLTMLSASLKALGIGKIRVTSSAREAFAALSDAVPDFAICDLQMESSDGLTFLKWVRSREDSPDRYLPVLMVSGHSEARRVAEARDAGVNDFLVKPVSAKSLYLRLTHAIENPRPFIRSATYFGPCRRRKNLGPPPGVAERRRSEMHRHV